MINPNDIFTINSEEEFNNAAVSIFNYQYTNVYVYKRFVDFLKIDSNKIKHYTEIPFLPVEFFKKHKILDNNINSDVFYFQSSGTTSENLSKHFIGDAKIYQKSILESFKIFFGEPSEYIYLGLLPSYLEKKNSSLIYMVDFLMKQSSKKENGYFLYNFEDLNSLIKKLESKNQKIILFGVSYALLDFANMFPQNLKNTYVIETGGMKGRKEEITKDELLKELQNAFNTQNIFSEYSMTELLSQAYSLGENVYKCPPWMKILIRDAEDPFAYETNGKTGGINIIDLANYHSCSFISTQDLGKLTVSDSFQVLGRMDNSDIRGCSLLLL
ncbi:acyl transferase [Apibacter raozihei]|uniref:LuxE/PaaK family acyltransferase n=1 Tax=Apibacter raozihei TaxID=2500547 RepID=UPI000FE3DAD6|nr:acyl transferase [Apibacter raozihei]